MPLRHVDPTRPRSAAYRWLARALGTNRAVLWLSKQIAWKLDPLVLRVTGGRLGLSVIVPTAVLETRGARTGAVRRNAVIYFHDGRDVIIVPSKAGAPTHPAWFHNLVAHPDVLLGGEAFTAVVVADDNERERLWAAADVVFPAFADYRRRLAESSERTIPLVRLIARDGGRLPSSP